MNDRSRSLLGPADPAPRAVLAARFALDAVAVPVELVVRAAVGIAVLFVSVSLRMVRLQDRLPSTRPPLGRWMGRERLRREWSREDTRWVKHVEAVLAAFSAYADDPRPSTAVTRRHQTRHRRAVYGPLFRRDDEFMDLLRARDYHGAGLDTVVEGAARHHLRVTIRHEGPDPELDAGTRAALKAWLVYHQERGTVTQDSRVESIPFAASRGGSVRLSLTRKRRAAMRAREDAEQRERWQRHHDQQHRLHGHR